ncbi:MAG: group II intron reverse transcriptase domain-containing protein [Erysipelotrichaceae bacterium]|nr:group II intron reverse transcriptase domain-containing protein [Erysipelotrichaceae bacterium]
MTILKELLKEEVWKDFRDYRNKRNQLGKDELRELDDFIAERRYLEIADKLEFDYPVKMMISKMGSTRKRTVYSYKEDETWVLKLLTHLLYKYDGKIADSCYSFRRNKMAKSAIDDILKNRNLDERYVLKADIHDYFNSIDVDLLETELRKIIDDDPEMLAFLLKLLKQDKCYWQNQLIEEKRGAMAGVPLASFFANIYLMEMDHFFEKEGIPYFRYSDDIIILADSKSQQEYCYEKLCEFVREKKLELNPDKLEFYSPHEKWSFLGFSYYEGKIDLSDATIRKMKDKIRRKAHRVYRSGKRKGRTYEAMARSMIRSFDYRFYDLSGQNDFTWTRFYFPVLSSTEGLHEIDRHMLEYLRFLKTGRFNKSNYRTSYEDIKKLGYTPLVAEFYNWKQENRMLDEQNRKQDDEKNPDR